MNLKEELKNVEFAMKIAVGGGAVRRHMDAKIDYFGLLSSWEAKQLSETVIAKRKVVRGLLKFLRIRCRNPIQLKESL